MRDDRVVVIGAGIGGLAAAIDLAAHGMAVTVLERAASAGGKIREIEVGPSRIDGGPTVFTMRWVFDALFQAAGAEFNDYVKLAPLEILARHAWTGGARFDLFADLGRAADAVAAFAGPEEGRRFLEFAAEAKAIYRTLREPFLGMPCSSPLTLATRIGPRNLPSLFGLRPFETLWGALSKHFHDPRLRQLFGRYATYVGSSPFMAPATLMLIAHVEQDGVWSIEGGMQRLAEALARLAARLGVAIRYEAEVRNIAVERGAAAGVALVGGERLSAGAIVINADAAALTKGLFGAAAAAALKPGPRAERSLSAITWAAVARAEGFPLLRHNVFFSDDYPAEFADLFGRARVPVQPTVYLCAQDRGGSDATDAGNAKDRERLLLLINAPATGDTQFFDAEEIAKCGNRVFSRLMQCGLILTPGPEATTTAITTPADFHRLFPGTGGALYGRASHGPMASFQRPASQTRIPGLYLAGGSTHPGAGVPMAALSGRLAAARLLSDRASTMPWRRRAISGGTSTG